MLKATIDGDAVRLAIAELKDIDPKMEVYLKRDIRSALSGPAAAIENAFPASSPLSGFNASATARSYQKPKASVSVTPGRARPGRVSTLIAIKIILPKTALRNTVSGAWIAEMAGLRGDYRSGFSRRYVKNFGAGQQHTLNGQGEAMVNALNQRYGSAEKGGRFGWRKFVNMKSNIQKIGIGILEDYVSKLNREN
jgi:hypothetical protein